jgi:hypothetical protein
MKGYEVSTFWEESLSQIHSYLLHYLTISLRMVNSREPGVGSGTRSACVFYDSEGHRTNLNLLVTVLYLWLLVDGFYM